MLAFVTYDTFSAHSGKEEKDNSDLCLGIYILLERIASACGHILIPANPICR